MRLLRYKACLTFGVVALLMTFWVVAKFSGTSNLTRAPLFALAVLVALLSFCVGDIKNRTFWNRPLHVLACALPLLALVTQLILFAAPEGWYLNYKFPVLALHYFLICYAPLLSVAIACIPGSTGVVDRVFPPLCTVVAIALTIGASTLAGGTSPSGFSSSLIREYLYRFQQPTWPRRDGFNLF